MYLKNYITRDTTTQLKGLAIIFVMLGHLGLIHRSGAWGVGLFLLISGYGLTQSYIKGGLDGFFKKRILSVIIPYSIVTILWIVVDFIMGERYSTSTIITSIIGLNFKAIIDITMWYIPFLMLWYIAFFITFKIFKKDYAKIISLFLFSIVVYLKLYELFNSNVGASLYTLLFPIGVLMSFVFSKELKISEKQVRNIIGIFLLISYLVFEISRNKSDVNEFYITSIIASNLLFVSIAMILYDLKSNALIFIGNISFELYLFEGVFINKYRLIFDNINSEVIAIILYFMMVLFLSIAYSKLIKKLRY